MQRLNTCSTQATVADRTSVLFGVEINTLLRIVFRENYGYSNEYQSVDIKVLLIRSLDAIPDLLLFSRSCACADLGCCSSATGSVINRDVKRGSKNQNSFQNRVLEIDYPKS